MAQIRYENYETGGNKFLFIVLIFRIIALLLNESVYNFHLFSGEFSVNFRDYETPFIILISQLVQILLIDNA